MTTREERWREDQPAFHLAQRGYHTHQPFFPTADDDDLIQCMGCDVEWQRLQAWHESVSDAALMDEVERRGLHA